MKYKLIIIFFAMLFMNACRFPSDEVENAEINSDSSNVNAAIKANFITEDSLPLKNIEMTISGKDAKHIFDIEGKTNFNIENGGVEFFVAPTANPTNEKPITFTIQANLEGYLPLKQEVVVYNTNQKIIVKCIFKKDKVSNTEQKKEVFLNEKKILKKGTNQTVNSNILSTKANNKKPSIIERKKERISIDTLPVITNSNIVSPKVEVKKPVFTNEVKKDSIIAKKEKISIDTLTIITNSNTVLPKIEVKKTVFTNEVKKDSIIAKKEKIKIDTLPVITNSNTVLPKIEVKKPALTAELKKDSIAVKKEKISIDTLPIITNSNTISPKVEVNKPALTAEVKKDSIIVKKEKISIDPLPIITNSNIVSPKVEVKKPAFTSEVKKDSITVKKEKISIDPLPIITNSNTVLPKIEVKKPALTAELKKDSIIAKKEKISIDPLPIITNSNTILPKVEVKKPAFTSEVKKDSITAKKEKISIDPLPIITNSNTVLPKIEVKKPAFTSELKKDSIAVKKEKIKIDTITLVAGSDSISSKTESQKNNLITTQKKDTIPFNKKNFGISLGFGTIGFNINLHHQISKKFGLRIGYAEAYYAPQYFTVFSGNSTNVIADFQIKMINLQLDYFPFKNKIFRVTTGISKNFNTYFINVTPLTSQTFGFIVYPPESIGSMKVEAIVSDFNPYLGIGFGKTIPNTKLGMGLDLGLFYHGSPKFKLITTGSFGPSNNEKNVSLMNNAFNDWVFFPMANINITYRITN